MTAFGTVTDQSDTVWANFTEAYHNYSQIDGSDLTVRKTVYTNGVDYAVSDYLYDALGRPSCAIVYMDPSSWGPQATTCTPLQTNGSKGPDQTTQIGYDAAGQQTSLVTGIGTADQRTEATVTYTPKGKTATATDAKGSLTSYTYDGFDRVAQVNCESEGRTFESFRARQISRLNPVA